MDRQQREQETQAAIKKLPRATLERIAFAAWQYHRETNAVCSVHDVGDDDAECICDWVNATRERADNTLMDLLPD